MKTKVFLVDDHPLMRRGAQLLIDLEPDLAVCGEADDVPTALEKIPMSKPDVVILDLSLKRGSGFELIKQVRNLFPHIRILVFSMHEAAQYAERSIRAGASGYLSKDEGTEKVVSAIRSIVQGKLYVGDQVAAHVLQQMWTGRSREVAGSIESLTDRELEVLHLIGQGLPTRTIATRLHLSPKTVEAHREHIKEKLGLNNAAELSRYAFRWAGDRKDGGAGATTESKDSCAQP